jgi:hypothetical protein
MAAIRIELRRESLIVRAVQPARLTHHGFGTFLENAQPGDISISKAAWVALKRCPYRSGLMGLEIFSGNVLAWGSPEPMIEVLLTEVSRSRDSDWFAECCVVESTLRE